MPTCVEYEERISITPITSEAQLRTSIAVQLKTLIHHFTEEFDMSYNHYIRPLEALMARNSEHKISNGPFNQPLANLKSIRVKTVAKLDAIHDLEMQKFEEQHKIAGNVNADGNDGKIYHTVIGDICTEIREKMWLTVIRGVNEMKPIISATRLRTVVPFWHTITRVKNEEMQETVSVKKSLQVKEMSAELTAEFMCEKLVELAVDFYEKFKTSYQIVQDVKLATAKSSKTLLFTFSKAYTQTMAILDLEYHSTTKYLTALLKHCYRDFELGFHALAKKTNRADDEVDSVVNTIFGAKLNELRMRQDNAIDKLGLVHYALTPMSDAIESWNSK